MSSAAVSASLTAPADSAAIQFRLGYRPWLDGLRGIAILLVLASHTEPILLPRGWLGVDLFFVLSGFLITTLLLEEWRDSGAISFRGFYMRRALRLFPALSIMLVASALTMYFVPSVGQQYHSILYSVFYVTNWVLALDLDKVSSALTITWSLAVEEQFYLIWPVVLYGCLRLRMRPRAILLILFGLIVAVGAHRSLLVLNGAPLLRTRYASDTRADSLLAGCFVGMLAHYGLLPRSLDLVRLISTVGALLFVLYLIGFGDPEALGLSLVALFFAGGLVILISGSGPPGAAILVLSNRSLVWIGKLSYSLYLWHLYAYFAVEQSGLDRRLWIVPSILLAFILASVSHYVIERPFLLLKKRYSPLRS